MFLAFFILLYIFYVEPELEKCFLGNLGAIVGISLVYYAVFILLYTFVVYPELVKFFSKVKNVDVF